MRIQSKKNSISDFLQKFGPIFCRNLGWLFEEIRFSVEIWPNFLKTLRTENCIGNYSRNYEHVVLQNKIHRNFVQDYVPKNSSRFSRLLQWFFLSGNSDSIWLVWIHVKIDFVIKPKWCLITVKTLRKSRPEIKIEEKEVLKENSKLIFILHSYQIKHLFLFLSKSQNLLRFPIRTKKMMQSKAGLKIGQKLFLKCVPFNTHLQDLLI